MALGHSPKIVTGGLVGCWDAGNIKSNRGKRSLINWDSWNTTGVGVLASAPAGFGGLNQSVANENSLVSGTDPWGNTNILWQSNPSGDSNADGGWAAAYNSTIDNTRLYRSSVWIRRISTSTSGTFYHGLATNGTGVVINLSNGASQTNPYWQYVGIGGLVQDTWYLSVGHIYPWNHSGTTYHPNSGRYVAGNATNQGTSWTGNIIDCKFPSNATTMYQRVYHFYSTDNTSKIQFFQPRLDLVDGTEPSIYELVNNVGSTWYDIVGGNNGTMINGPGYSSGAMTFDGTDDYITCPSSSNYAFGTGDFTLEVWVKPLTVTGYMHFLAFPSQSTLALKSYNGLVYLYTPSYSTYSTITNWNITLNNWNCISFSRQSGVGYAYINGDLKGSKSSFNDNFTTQVLNIHNGYGALEYNPCQISNIKIYNRALTAAEVKQNFNALRGRFGL